MSPETQPINEVVQLYSSLSKEDQKITRKALYELFRNHEERDQNEKNAESIPPFCGISKWGDLNDSQKELFTESSQEERDVISEIYTIIKGKEIQCHPGNLAIEYEDHYERNHQLAEELEDEIGNGWRLPNDIRLSDHKLGELSLQSDYDKMIYYMPGKGIKEKCRKFYLLTGMEKDYWTKQKYSAPLPKIDNTPSFGVWTLDGITNSRDRKKDIEHNSSNKVRLVKSI